MKTFSSLSILAAFVLMVTMGSCNKLSKPQLSNNTDTASYAYGVYIGKSLVNQKMNVLNVDLVHQGMADVLKNDKDTMEIMDVQMILSAFFQQQQSDRIAKEYEGNKKAGEEFLAKNKLEDGVITTESGLQYKVIQEGTGASPQDDDVVHVFYKGTLIDGTAFDSSLVEPAVFPVNSVIKGWTEVLKLMKEGSKYMVYIPQELAYGSSEMGGGVIPPYSTLIFEIELVKVDPKE